MDGDIIMIDCCKKIKVESLHLHPSNSFEETRTVVIYLESWCSTQHTYKTIDFRDYFCAKNKLFPCIKPNS